MSKSTAPLTPAMLDLIKYSGGGENVLKAGTTRAALIRRGLVHPMDSNRAGKLTEAGMQVWAKANPAPVGETAADLEVLSAEELAGSLMVAAEHGNPEHIAAVRAEIDRRLSVEAPRLAEDRYFTHGCGADTLKRDAPEAEAPRFDFAERAAAQVKRNAEIAARAASYVDRALPQREPGKALVEELLGGEVDEAMGLPAMVTDREVAEVLRDHSIEKLTPVNPLSVLLRPVRGELVDRATRETFVAVGDVWGVREGYRFRIVCEDSSDMLHGRPLMFMWVGEPQWMLAGDESCDTPRPLLEGTVVQINGWVSYQVQARPGYALPHLVRIN